MQLSRRRWLACGCALPVSAFASLALPVAARAAGQPAPPTITPEKALALLKEGNRDFVADEPRLARAFGRSRRLELVDGQAPLAVVLSCSDSRVPPEHVFSRGLGEMFAVRNAGNIVDAAALGSLEYGVVALGAPLVVVLGHRNCGAVQAAISVVESDKTYPPSIAAMIAPLLPAVLAARHQPGDLLDNAVRTHVKRSVKRLNDVFDSRLRDADGNERLRIVGARYELRDGKVEFLDPA